MTLVEALCRVLPISIFVETGTFEGETVARARDSFAEIHSIELSDHHHAGAMERFAGDERVTLYHGDSGQVLASLKPMLEDKAVLYWLDAHWCFATETAGERSQCALLRELAALSRLNAKSVVLIDDARLFLATPPQPHEASNWPRLQEVVDSLQRLSSDHELMVVNDVMIFFPGTARAVVSEHASSHGIDWLRELDRLSELEQERDQLASTADERRTTIDGLTKAAADRLAVIQALERECDLQTKAGQERLAAIEDLTRERDMLATAAEERLAALEDLTRERDLQTKAAQDRLATIEDLTRERDMLATAAEERLAALEDLRRELDLQAGAASERLQAIQDLTRERDLQAKAADERLRAIEQLEREQMLRASRSASGWG